MRVAQEKYDRLKFKVDKKAVVSNLTALEEYISYFSNKGVRVIFFEMPRDCEIENNILSIYSRKITTKIIEEYHMREIPLPPCKDYNTNDGLHLTESSSTKYTKYFLSR